jgi:hypothetical protein
MQTRLEFKRFPSRLAIAFALSVTLLVGGAVGYTLKPSSLTPGSSRVFVMPLESSSGTDVCIYVNKHKAC